MNIIDEEQKTVHIEDRDYVELARMNIKLLMTKHRVTYVDLANYRKTVEDAVEPQSIRNQVCKGGFSAAWYLKTIDVISMIGKKKSAIAAEKKAEKEMLKQTAKPNR